MTPYHIFTFASGLQNLSLVPAQIHLGSERSRFCDVFDPEYLLVDPGQYHQLFWGNPNLQLLFYSSNNSGNEEGPLGRGKEGWTLCGAEMSLRGKGRCLRPWQARFCRLTPSPGRVILIFLMGTVLLFRGLSLRNRKSRQLVSWDSILAALSLWSRPLVCGVSNVPSQVSSKDHWKTQAQQQHYSYKVAKEIILWLGVPIP